MNCQGCGLPLTPEEMGVNFKGEKVQYHSFQAKCVELLRAQVAEVRVPGYGDAAHLKCEKCGGRYDSAKHQLSCVSPTLQDESVAWMEQIADLQLSLKKCVAERDALNLQVDEYRKALHKIACAECTVHDDHCEVRRYDGAHDCACDARVAGDASKGYVCPVLGTVEKPLSNAPNYTFSNQGDTGPFLDAGGLRVVDGGILAPSGSCPCRMDGETLIACERHAIKRVCDHQNYPNHCTLQMGHDGEHQGQDGLWT